MGKSDPSFAGWRVIGQETYAAALAVVVGAVLLGAWLTLRKCNAYWPVNCSLEYAANDARDSDAIIIGRVVQLGQVSEPQHDTVGYVAKVRIGQALKGSLKKGEEAYVGIGGRPPEDDVTPTTLNLGTNHPGYDLLIDGIYLMFLNRVPADRKAPKDMRGHLWRPRSCHFSIHQLVGAEGGSLAVVEGTFPCRDTQPVPLEEFMQGHELKVPGDANRENTPQNQPPDNDHAPDAPAPPNAD